MFSCTDIDPLDTTCFRSFSVTHREMIWCPRCLDHLCVARFVGKVEIDKAPVAKAAMEKELDRLRSNNVLDEDHPRERDDVRVEARRGGGGYLVRMDFVFGICAENRA